MVNLFKCPKNKRPSGLPPDIRLSRLHLELPYMQNVLAHGMPPRSGVIAGTLIRFLNILGRPTPRSQPRNAVRSPHLLQRHVLQVIVSSSIEKIADILALLVMRKLLPNMLAPSCRCLKQNQSHCYCHCARVWNRFHANTYMLPTLWEHVWMTSPDTTCLKMPWNQNGWRHY